MPNMTIKNQSDKVTFTLCALNLLNSEDWFGQSAAKRIVCLIYCSEFEKSTTSFVVSRLIQGPT